MKSINNILIATDLDESSSSVIKFGLSLAESLEAKVRFIYVARPLSSHVIATGKDWLEENLEGMVLDVPSKEMIASQKETLQELVESVKLNSPFTDQPISTIVTMGTTAESILSEAQLWDADLIILGLHNVARKINYAPIASEIIELAHCSVMVVPLSYHYTNFKNVGTFINFEFDEIPMVMNMVDYVKKEELKMTMIHILDNESIIDDIKNKLKIYHRLFAKETIQGMLTYQIRTRNIEKVIPSLTQEENIGLFVMRAQKRHWKLLNFTPDMALEVFKFIKVPLLIWRSKTSQNG